MSDKIPTRLPKLNDKAQEIIAKLATAIKKQVSLHQDLDRKLESITKILNAEEFIYFEGGAPITQTAKELCELISKSKIGCESYENLVSDLVKKVFNSGELMKHNEEVCNLTMSFKHQANSSSPEVLKDLLRKICNILSQFEWVLRLDKIDGLSGFSDEIKEEITELQKQLLNQAKLNTERENLGNSEKPESFKESNSLVDTEGFSFPEHEIGGAKSDGNEDFFTMTNKEKTCSTSNKSKITKPESTINSNPDSEKPESPKVSNSLGDTEGSNFPELKIDGAKSDWNEDFYTKTNLDETGSTTNKSIVTKPESTINSNADSSQNTYNVNKNIFKIPAIDECNAGALMARLEELLDENLGSGHILEQLEISSSDIKEEHFKRILEGIKCQIWSLSIGFNNARNEYLIPYCCKIIDKCNTHNLILESNQLKDEDINLLQDCIVKGKEMNELNISYNEDITDEGYYKLGKILIENEVRIFRAADCDLQDDELEHLINGMKDAKAITNANTNTEDISAEEDESKVYKQPAGLSQDKTTNHKTPEDIVRSAPERTIGYSDEDLLSFQSALLQELDISYSSSLTPRGFGLLANLVLKKGVKKIKLSDAQLTFEKLDEFYRVLKHGGAVADSATGQDMLLEELEVSYNSSLEPEAYMTLGIMVKICGVKRLSLAGCGVNEKHLENLRKHTRKHKMTSVNAADNKSIGEGIVEIAKIVQESNLEELDISQCMLMDTELRSFRVALGTAKLPHLNLSDCDRDPNERYVEEVCQLTSNITKKLVLEWGNISPEVRNKLQNALDAVCHSTTLKIVLNEENEDILH